MHALLLSRFGWFTSAMHSSAYSSQMSQMSQMYRHDQISSRDWIGLDQGIRVGQEIRLDCMFTFNSCRKDGGSNVYILLDAQRFSSDLRAHSHA